MQTDFSGTTLASWLTYLNTLHPIEIDMGVERISQVRDRLNLHPLCPVITVGGTNGKGSTVSMLATILTKAGYKVGSYTSPHLLHYQERICINTCPVIDTLLLDAFTQINAARQETTLTYFEFTTLAAMQIFLQEKVDVIILEVGLGGRVDATNIFDADVAAIVSIDLDHEHYLGDTREKIGFEKAGIFRADKPALCADPAPPHSLIQYAHTIGAPLELYSHDFGYHLLEEHGQLSRQWSFYHGEKSKHALPFPALQGQMQLVNASLVLAILDHLRDPLPVSIADIKTGLLEVTLMGRFQLLPGRPTVVLDVAHNPHAARVLRNNLDNMGFYEKTFAVFGMMQDKDILQVLHILKDRIDQWYLASPFIARAASTDTLIEQCKQVGITTYHAYPTVEAAYHAAYSHASENDRILIFGSFYTVAESVQARSGQ